MSIASGIFLLALGAILAFAVQANLTWITITTAGYILMAAGLLVTIISITMAAMARKRSTIIVEHTGVDANGNTVTRRESKATDPR